MAYVRVFSDNFARRRAMMKTLITTIIAFHIFILCMHRADADLFYWDSEYKSLYDDKVSIELLYNKTRSEYANAKQSFNEQVRNLESEIDRLRTQLSSTEARNESDARMAELRMKELEKQLTILKSAASKRQRDLIEENSKLNARLSGEILRLNREKDKDAAIYRDNMADIKKTYERERSELLARIDERDDNIAKLKKLSETQKSELARLTRQAGELESQLDEEIKQGKIRVKKLQDRIIINLDDKICFDTGSSRLKPEILRALDKIIDILSAYPENKINIEGNTDNVPIHNAQFRDNWQLSTERALSVLEYVLSRTKLNPERISVIGNGEFNPVLPNDTDDNRALNRRVDIIVIPSVDAK